MSRPASPFAPAAPPSPIFDPWAAAFPAYEAAVEATLTARCMPSLAGPIHPRACDCRECRRTWGPRR